MGQIGFDVNTYGGSKSNQNVNSTSWTGLEGNYTYTPAVTEKVTSFNVRGRAASAAGTITAVLYDATDIEAAIPVGDPVTFTGLTTSYADYSIPPAAEIILTAGTPYAIAFLSSDTTVNSFIEYGATGAGGDLRQDGAPSQTPPNPYITNFQNDRAVGLYALTEAAAGPTLTGPDSTTDGTATQATGTDLDTVTTFSLVSDVSSIVQSIDGQTPTTLDYIANSGVNDCVPGTPSPGVPLEATITAPGITPYQIVQRADDGTNAANRNITLNAPATKEVIHTMIASANTIDDQSIFGTSWIDVENDMQAYVPKQAGGMNITWNADGTFTTDSNQTEVIVVTYFSPNTGQWSCLNLTIQMDSILSVGGPFDFPNFQFPILDDTP